MRCTDVQCGILFASIDTTLALTTLILCEFDEVLQGRVIRQDGLQQRTLWVYLDRVLHHLHQCSI